jgi:hypothetical protein
MERPILMSTENVKAILEGRKTQSRRVIKPQPKFVPSSECGSGKDQWEYHPVYWYAEDGPGRLMNRCCPYGQVGDKLWVRETHYRYGKWVKNGFTKTGKQKWTFRGQAKEVRYYDNPPEDVRPNRYREPAWYKRPSIFMPRWASRITLEITEIRVERLQEITGEDMNREGIVYDDLWGKFSIPDWDTFVEAQEKVAISAFTKIWDSINGKKHPWSSNPWVWCISFKMLKDRDEGR